METLEEKIRRVVSEDVEIVPCDPRWPALFEEERLHLLECMPPGLLLRVEHFGSTSVPGLCAKPIVDMLIEVSNLERARVEVPPVLEPQGYDCFWRPLGKENVPPYYQWCVKRGSKGERTHHLHMVEKDSERWRDLIFRDWLRSHPEDAKAYGELKLRLAREHRNDRIAYTEAKGEFILRILAKAAL